VCLTITSANGCSDVTCFDVAVSANNVANTYISGVASFLVNGTSYYPDNLNLYLLKYDAVTQQLNLVQSLNTGSQPNYYFSYVPAGNYIIKAAPSPSNIAYNSIIVPTYSTNALLWSSATTYTVASGTPVYNADINMQLGVSTSGPGLITGSVLTGANKTRAVGDPKKGLTVLLFNKANGKIINYTKTDTDGVFQFVNLPLGTYKIFLEETGKTMVAAEITITNNTQKAENVDFVSNKKENHPLGYFPSSNNNVIVQKGDFIIYPNPMQDYVNISSGLLLALDVQVEAIGIDGKIVLSEKMIPTNNTIQLNTSNFKKGMYIIKVTSKDNTYTTQITKQ
jgi:Secretion system C-terminal sorting domain/Carboxypeptidase regulatory-like domain